MKRLLLTMFLVLLAAGRLRAEKVADLPMPTAYVMDFAGVLSPDAKAHMEALAEAAKAQANADLEVVTIKSLDDGQSVEEFTAALEEKWKLGKKGEDRSTLLLLVLSPHKLRIETGYGLEGILNDAKVGAILDQATPYAKTGNYDQALETAEQGIADVVAADAHVTLTPIPIVHHYHQVPAQPQGSGAGRIVLGILGVIVFIILVRTGNIGWAFYLLTSLLGGGGGGGGGRDDDDRGGGFGGSGGGASGGGGASRDF